MKRVRSGYPSLWLYASIGAGKLPPLCFIMQWYSHDDSSPGWEGTWPRPFVVVTRDGMQVPVDLGRVVWEPGFTDDTERAWRQRIPAIPAQGYLEDECIDVGQPIFLDGCRVEGGAKAGGIGPCRDRPLVVTPGDGSPEPRITMLAEDLLGWLGIFSGALMLLLLCGLWAFGVGPAVQALERLSVSPRRAMAPRSIAAWVGFLGVAALFVQWVVAMVRDPDTSGLQHPFALGIAAFGVAMLRVVWRRRRALQAAMRPVLDAPTVPLHRASTGDMVELAVRVSDDAPLLEGPLTGQHVAFYGVSVVQSFRRGKETFSELESDRIEPPMLPIVDESGPGYLDLTHAQFDLRAVRHVPSAVEVEVGRWKSILGSIEVKPYASFEIEERQLSPGESLYVLGMVDHRQPTEDGGGYRAAAGVPVIGAAEGAGLIVYAGTERGLLAKLRWKRTCLDLLRAAFLVLTVTLMVVSAIATAM